MKGLSSGAEEYQPDLNIVLCAKSTALPEIGVQRIPRAVPGLREPVVAQVEDVGGVISGVRNGGLTGGEACLSS